MIALIYKGLLDVLSRLTANRAAGLDNLDAAVSSRLSGSDSRLNNINATISSRLASTDARLNALDGIASGVVKSVQRGSTTITGATTTQAITAVNLSKTVLVFSWPDIYYQHSAQLTSTTQISFYRTGGSATPAVQWQVVEFN